MDYKYKTLTNDGASLMAQDDSNQVATIIDKMIFSNQQIDPNSMADLHYSDINAPLQFAVTAMKHNGNTFQPECTITNDNVQQDYSLNVVGVCGHPANDDNSNDETLVGIAYTDDPLVLPAKSNTEFKLWFAGGFTYSNAQNVQANITNAGQINQDDLDNALQSYATNADLSSAASSLSTAAGNNSAINQSLSNISSSVDNMSGSLTDLYNGGDTQFQSYLANNPEFESELANNYFEGYLTDYTNLDSDIESSLAYDLGQNKALAGSIYSGIAPNIHERVTSPLFSVISDNSNAIASIGLIARDASENAGSASIDTDSLANDDNFGSQLASNNSLAIGMTSNNGFVDNLANNDSFINDITEDLDGAGSATENIYEAILPSLDSELPSNNWFCSSLAANQDFASSLAANPEMKVSATVNPYLIAQDNGFKSVVFSEVNSEINAGGSDQQSITDDNKLDLNTYPINTDNPMLGVDVDTTSGPDNCTHFSGIIINTHNNHLLQTAIMIGIITINSGTKFGMWIYDSENYYWDPLIER